jgi:hypothetical protein
LGPPGGPGPRGEVGSQGPDGLPVSASTVSHIQFSPVLHSLLTIFFPIIDHYPHMSSILFHLLFIHFLPLHHHIFPTQFTVCTCVLFSV